MTKYKFGGEVYIKESDLIDYLRQLYDISTHKEQDVILRDIVEEIGVML